MTDTDPVWQARQALKTARERQQAGDEWSAGYEAGRALELLNRELDDREDDDDG